MLGLAPNNLNFFMYVHVHTRRERTPKERYSICFFFPFSRIGFCMMGHVTNLIVYKYVMNYTSECWSAL